MPQSFAAGYQVAAAVLHPLAITWQNQVVFNAEPYSTVLGLSMGVQSEVGLWQRSFQLGPQGVLVAMVQF